MTTARSMTTLGHCTADVATHVARHADEVVSAALNAEVMEALGSSSPAGSIAQEDVRTVRICLTDNGGICVGTFMITDADSDEGCEIAQSAESSGSDGVIDAFLAHFATDGTSSVFAQAQGQGPAGHARRDCLKGTMRTRTTRTLVDRRASPRFEARQGYGWTGHNHYADGYQRHEHVATRASASWRAAPAAREGARTAMCAPTHVERKMGHSQKGQHAHRQLPLVNTNSDGECFEDDSIALGSSGGVCFL